MRDVSTARSSHKPSMLSSKPASSVTFTRSLGQTSSHAVDMSNTIARSSEFAPPFRWSMISDAEQAPEHGNMEQIIDMISNGVEVPLDTIWNAVEVERSRSS